LGIVIVTSSHYPSAVTSPGLCKASLASVLAAIACLAIALALAKQCGACVDDNWIAKLVGLMVALAVSSVVIFAGIVPSAIPVAGSILILAVLLSVMSQMGLFYTLKGGLEDMVRCLTGRFPVGLTADLIHLVWVGAVVFSIGACFFIAGAISGELRRPRDT
jgi:hypothetical protein